MIEIKARDSNVPVPSGFPAGVLIARKEGFEEDSQFKYRIVLVYVLAGNLKKEPIYAFPICASHSSFGLELDIAY
jgi:hypothetical protein